VLPYTAYEIDQLEYIGHFDGTLDECETQLKERGYHYQLFAAEKQLGTVTDDGSWARIPTRHPEAVTGTALDGRDPRNCQYHVHLFEMEDGIDLYGHYEIHPYPWIPTFDIDRSLNHYRPTWDSASSPDDASRTSSTKTSDTKDNDKSEWTYLRGVRDIRLNTILSDTWVTKQRTP
jgi:hypothetical protein